MQLLIKNTPERKKKSCSHFFYCIWKCNNTFYFCLSQKKKKWIIESANLYLYSSQNCIYTVTHRPSSSTVVYENFMYLGSHFDVIKNILENIYTKIEWERERVSEWEEREEQGNGNGMYVNWTWWWLQNIFLFRR